jgi:hypothetical protein
MKSKLLMFVLVILFVSIGFVSAEQTLKTIQANLLFTPSANTNQNYSTIFPLSAPDNIAKIYSFQVNLQGDFPASTSIQVFTNKGDGNITCYPNKWSTPNVVANNYNAHFECSANFINTNFTSGNVLLGFNVNKTSTNIQPSLLINYYNNPFGTMTLSGTEYSPDDPATMFVQLKDSQGLPVMNGSCNLDIWYPLNATGQHPYTVQDAPMLKALGDDGIYYYDMTAPSILGVYMLSAKCSYAYNWIWFYPPTESIYKPIMSAPVFGTWTGNTLSLNGYDMNFYQCDVASLGNGCVANFTYNLSSYGNFYNVTNINIYYAGQIKGSASNDWTLTLSYWNGTSFVNLPNTLVLKHQANAPDGVNQLLTNSVSTSAIINNTIIIQYSLKGGTGTGTSVYNDWLSIALLSSSGTVQDVRGSSEMHITNKANVTVTATVNNTDIANSIWSATNRTLTYYPSQIDMTNYTLIAQTIWNYAIRNLTYERDMTNYSSIVIGVWNYTTRNLTFYPAQTDIINYSLITSNVVDGVWNATNRNLTYYPTAFDMTNYTQIVNDVWSATNRTLTYTVDVINYNSIIVGVWNYTTRNLTFYPVDTDTINYTLISQSVWDYNGTVNPNLISQFVSSIWAFTSTISANILGQVSTSIWNNVDRNLTYYPAVNASFNQTDMTNYTKIGDEVWDAHEGRYVHGIVNS